MPDVPAPPSPPSAPSPPAVPVREQGAAPRLAPRADPLHGLTLEAQVLALQAHYGWAGLGQRIALRCFTTDPSVSSSLKFLRRTPWAREKVQSLYLFMLREQKRDGG